MHNHGDGTYCSNTPVPGARMGQYGNENADKINAFIADITKRFDTLDAAVVTINQRFDTLDAAIAALKPVP